MNEIGTSITTTGLIATVVSVIFAIAAFYVSHRNRAQSVTGASPAPVRKPPVAKTEPASPAPAASRAYKPAPVVETELEAVSSKPAFSTGPTGSPLFKKLGTKGSEPPVAEPHAPSSSLYVWE